MHRQHTHSDLESYQQELPLQSQVGAPQQMLE